MIRGKEIEMTKLCPFRFNVAAGNSVVCLSNRCAFWICESKECAVVKIAKFVKNDNNEKGVEEYEV